jgi:hypothetical protein
MKKIIVILSLLIITTSLFAQIDISMSLNGRPPANLTDWANRRDVLTFILGGAQTVRVEVKIKTEIKKLDGTVIGATNLNTAPVYVPKQGAPTILGALDVLPLDNIIFTGKYQTALQRTGKLPADNYLLCVQLVRVPDYAPVSTVLCKNFYLAAYQLPILMIPANGQELNANIAQTAVTFRWTPLVPASSSPATYRLRVFEVLENQKDMQALRSNQPLLDKNIVGTTQFIWQPQLSMMTYVAADSSTTNKTAGKKFIWTIQTLDNLGQPINPTDGNGESLSEPHVFYVVKNASGAKQKN